MKARCYRPRHESYARYHSKGITVCKKWLHSFEAFLADIGKRPSKNHSIDRIDDSRGYEPGNVRWATWSQQMKNRVPTKRFLAAVRKNAAKARKAMLAAGGVRHDPRTGRFTSSETPRQS
jgi:hypothetical protein